MILLFLSSEFVFLFIRPLIAEMLVVVFVRRRKIGENEVRVDFLSWGLALLNFPEGTLAQTWQVAPGRALFNRASKDRDSRDLCQNYLEMSPFLTH